MKLYRELEFADGRILQIPISIIYDNNCCFGPLALLIPLFVGSASVAATATTSAVAGTSGLIGTGGVVTAAGVGGALAAGGAIYGGVAAQKERKFAAAMSEYNAKVAKVEGEAIDRKAAYEQKRQAQEAARTMGTLVAGLGASGAIPSEGTPLLLQAKQASELELENLMIGYEGKIGVSRAKSQATLDKMQASLYRQQGRNRMIGAYMGAGSTLLTGFSQG